MAISVTGRVVKIKSKSELKRVGSNKMNSEALNYNHLRILFADGSDRHFLFTDNQMKKAINRGKEVYGNSEDVKIIWVKEVWYEGVMDIGVKDIKEDIKNFDLPKEAKSFNHIRVSIDGKDQHLLFADSVIRSSLKRAKQKGGKLPKVSWLSDCFFNEKVKEELHA